jgi:hypothetical protein
MTFALNCVLLKETWIILCANTNSNCKKADSMALVAWVLKA